MLALYPGSLKNLNMVRISFAIRPGIAVMSEGTKKNVVGREEPLTFRYVSFICAKVTSSPAREIALPEYFSGSCGYERRYNVCTWANLEGSASEFSDVVGSDEL